MHGLAVSAGMVLDHLYARGVLWNVQASNLEPEDHGEVLELSYDGIVARRDKALIADSEIVTTNV